MIPNGYRPLPRRNRAPAARPRLLARRRAPARGANRPRRTIPVGHREGAGRGRVPRNDHAESAWRPEPLVPRRRAGDRGNGKILHAHRAHRGRDQYGRNLNGDGLWQRSAEKARGAAGAGGRQARHLHHRAGRRQRRARHDHARGQALGIGGFLAVRDEAKEGNKGLRVARREQTMGLRGMPEGELVFENLEVPASMAVLPTSGLRLAFADLRNAYNSQRVGAGTVAMGSAAGALEHALEWAKTREQFGRKIGEFQGLQWMLADMQTQLPAARLMLHPAGRSRGPDGSAFPDPMLAAQAKIFASESAIKIVNDALQFFGARGYSRELPLERMARDVRMFTIGGGTAQVLRTLVAGKMLGWKLPQTREGYAPKPPIRDAAE